MPPRQSSRTLASLRANVNTKALEFRNAFEAFIHRGGRDAETVAWNQVETFLNRWLEAASSTNTSEARLDWVERWCRSQRSSQRRRITRQRRLADDEGDGEQNTSTGNAAAANPRSRVNGLTGRSTDTSHIVVPVAPLSAAFIDNHQAEGIGEPNGGGQDEGANGNGHGEDTIGGENNTGDRHREESARNGHGNGNEEDAIDDTDPRNDGDSFGLGAGGSDGDDGGDQDEDDVTDPASNSDDEEPFDSGAGGSDGDDHGGQDEEEHRVDQARQAERSRSVYQQPTVEDASPSPQPDLNGSIAAEPLFREHTVQSGNNRQSSPPHTSSLRGLTSFALPRQSTDLPSTSQQADSNVSEEIGRLVAGLDWEPIRLTGRTFDRSDLQAAARLIIRRIPGFANFGASKKKAIVDFIGCFFDPRTYMQLAEDISNIKQQYCGRLDDSASSNDDDVLPHCFDKFIRSWRLLAGHVQGTVSRSVIGMKTMQRQEQCFLSFHNLRKTWAAGRTAGAQAEDNNDESPSDADEGLYDDATLLPATHISQADIREFQTFVWSEVDDRQLPIDLVRSRSTTALLKALTAPYLGFDLVPSSRLFGSTSRLQPTQLQRKAERQWRNTMTRGRTVCIVVEGLGGGALAVIGAGVLADIGPRTMAHILPALVKEFPWLEGFLDVLLQVFITLLNKANDLRRDQICTFRRAAAVGTEGLLNACNVNSDGLKGLFENGQEGRQIGNSGSLGNDLDNESDSDSESDSNGDSDRPDNARVRRSALFPSRENLDAADRGEGTQGRSQLMTPPSSTVKRKADTWGMVWIRETPGSPSKRRGRR
ncbi:MAG: hypothetical protein Q9218_006881 [Villophora microphyllina]